MSKRRKAGVRYDRQRPHGVHLAIDRGRARRRWGADRRFGRFLIVLAFATIVAGFLFARTRMPASMHYAAHHGGAQYIPGTTVRFGEDQPANGNNEVFGEAVDPDITQQVPAPEAESANDGGGQGDAETE